MASQVLAYFSLYDCTFGDTATGLILLGYQMRRGEFSCCSGTSCVSGRCTDARDDAKGMDIYAAIIDVICGS